MTATLSAAAKPGALSPAQMKAIHASAPGYRAPATAPAVAHAELVRRLWGGHLAPMMAATDASGRFAGAALTCPPTACTGMLTLADGAGSKAWRNPDAIENVFCYEGRLQLRYGAALEHAIVLDRFDMASVPAGVRHTIANAGPGDARALVVLSVPQGGTYDAVFNPADAGGPTSAHDALGVRLDASRGLEVDAAAVASRVTRFTALVPYKKDLNRTGGLPPEATESLSAGNVFPLIVPEGHAGRSRTAPIYGNQGLYIALAECRSGDDHPPAHAHWDTQENFFVLDGTFEIYTGFDNESAIPAVPGDLVAMPKQVMRTFRNTTGRPARMIAIIQGPDRMRDVVAFSRRIGADFERRFGPETLEAYERIGMVFDAEDRLGVAAA
jgi:uncharacterized RmlC-like cupin family protein